MSKNHKHQFNHSDNMVCPECNGAGHHEKQSTARMHSVTTCSLCGGNQTINKKWWKKVSSALATRFIHDTLENTDQLTHEQKEALIDGLAVLCNLDKKTARFSVEYGLKLRERG